MLGQSENEEGSDRECQGKAPNELPCNLAATVHCISAICGFAIFTRKTSSGTSA